MRGPPTKPDHSGVRSAPVGAFDITSTYLIEAGPADWLALAGLIEPGSAAAVRAVDADLSTVSNAPDKLLRVDGPGGPFLVHLETQSGADVRFDDRVLLYHVLARWRHGLPVRSVAFLLRPAAVTPGLAGRVRDVVGGRVRLAFDYDLVRVWELPVETVLAGGVATLPLAPVSAVRPGELAGVIARMRDRLDREVDRPEAADLWQSTAVYLGLRYDKPFVKALLSGVLGMTESVIYQEIVAEGLARGKAEGKAEGERTMLVRRATRRFQVPPPPAALARLAAVTDTAELERLDEALDAATSWDVWLGR